VRVFFVITLLALAAAAAASSAGGPTVTAATCGTDPGFRSGLAAILRGPVSPTRPYTAARAVTRFRRAGIALRFENDLLELRGNVPDSALCDYRWYGAALSVRPAVMYQLYVLSTPATALREQHYHVAAARRSGSKLVARARGNVLAEVRLPTGATGPAPRSALLKLAKALASL
jgi:hypothetical protein